MRKPDDPAWAIYDSTSELWLVDSCADTTWSIKVADAVWFSEKSEATMQLHHLFPGIASVRTRYLVIRIQ